MEKSLLIQVAPQRLVTLGCGGWDFSIAQHEFFIFVNLVKYLIIKYLIRHQISWDCCESHNHPCNNAIGQNGFQCSCRDFSLSRSQVIRSYFCAPDECSFSVQIWVVCVFVIFLLASYIHFVFPLLTPTSPLVFGFNHFLRLSLLINLLNKGPVCLDHFYDLLCALLVSQPAILVFQGVFFRGNIMIGG